MQLPDFVDFEPLNDLRRAMGDAPLGSFEFFDYQKQLTGLEWQDLSRYGLALSLTALGKCEDGTLRYKDSRVVALDKACSEPMLHIAYCHSLAKANEGDLVPEYQVVNQAQALNDEYENSRGFVVCYDCLQALKYQGFDYTRSRKRGLCDEIHAAFSLQEFFLNYPAIISGVTEEANKAWLGF